MFMPGRFSGKIGIGASRSITAFEQPMSERPHHQPDDRCMAAAAGCSGESCPTASTAGRAHEDMASGRYQASTIRELAVLAPVSVATKHIDADKVSHTEQSATPDGYPTFSACGGSWRPPKRGQQLLSTPPL